MINYSYKIICSILVIACCACMRQNEEPLPSTKTQNSASQTTKKNAHNKDQNLEAQESKPSQSSDLEKLQQQAAHKQEPCLETLRQIEQSTGQSIIYQAQVLFPKTYDRAYEQGPQAEQTLLKDLSSSSCDELLSKQ